VATGHPVVVQGSVANLSGTTNGAVFNSVYYNRLTVSVIGS
jgi:hypothetical protein